MNATARNMTGLRFPKQRPTFFLALDRETDQSLIYRTEDDAFSAWCDYGDTMDFLRIDPDAAPTSLNDDFTDRQEAERSEAAAYRRHERSMSDMRRYI